MIDILRNMTRRKMRTSLTVLGIVIGVFALTVMGAMAEKMNLLVAGGLFPALNAARLNPVDALRTE